MADWENNEEIKIFREYLKIPSVHPNIDYEPCIKFLKKQSEDLSLPFKIITPGGADMPILIITWAGTKPSLPTIVLSSHMDVVPVYPDMWTHPPFGAEIDSSGNIYARGAQDMKSVGMQYLGAIRSLKNSGIKLKRTIHIVFVPDEETGGVHGSEALYNSSEFQLLNLGFALDEGIADPGNVFSIFYAERAVWEFNINCTETRQKSAGEKMTYVMDKLMSIRKQEVIKLQENPNLVIGDVTTVNLTMLKGDLQKDRVLTAHFDIRISVDTNHKQFERQLSNWCLEAGDGTEIEFTQKTKSVNPTKLDDSNVFWVQFQKATEESGIQIKPQVFPGATDGYFYRMAGIPTIGFSPMNNTPILLHDHDEFLNAETYLKGIEIYQKIISNVANA